MKAFIAICVIALVASSYGLSDEQRKKVKQYEEECLADSNVDANILKDAKAGKFEKDDKLNRYVYCFMHKAGLINEAGELQIDTIKAKITPDIGAEEVEKVIQACKDRKGKNPEHTAAIFYKCYYETSSKHVPLF